MTFSILNTFIMSVLERTREFGIMLALGATPLRIGTLVFIETALLALIQALAYAVYSADEDAYQERIRAFKLK